jgi:hypothetical protein
LIDWPVLPEAGRTCHRQIDHDHWRLGGVPALSLAQELLEDTTMGRGILLWLLGVPIPIIIILALIWH